MKKLVSVLIPTFSRLTSLAMTLTSLYYQSFKDFEIIISDQNKDFNIASDPALKAIIRLLNFKENTISVYKNLPRKGMAQQRQFLLNKSRSSYSLFLDDDLILETYVLKNLIKTIKEEKCGFVGQGLIGLSHINDERDEEEKVEYWKGKVKPEKIWINSTKWARYRLHNAANLLHLQEKLGLSSDFPKKYKVAWVGACVLYDTDKLKSSGGFQFWKDVPSSHSGEDAVVQLNVMAKYGGCAILPSGVYHQEVPTTLPKREVDLPKILLKQQARRGAIWNTKDWVQGL